MRNKSYKNLKLTCFLYDKTYITNYIANYSSNDIIYITYKDTKEKIYVRVH